MQVGDLIHEVDSKNIHSLSPREITQLITGPPSTFVILKISDGKAAVDQSESTNVNGSLGAAYLLNTIPVRIKSQRVEEDLRQGILQSNSILDEQRGWCALHFAAAEGNWHLADALLRSGADPDLQTTHGRTATDIARNNGQHELADHLIDISMRSRFASKDKERHGTASSMKTSVHAPGTLGGFSQKSKSKSQHSGDR